MNEPTASREHSLTPTRSGEAGRVTYSLEVAARLGGVHPEMLRFYCRRGLFGNVRMSPEAELTFDDDSLFELRRFEHYRRHHGMSREALRLITTLAREVERLERELRVLRGP